MDARLNDIRPHNPDLADTLARWLDDARCIDRDIDAPLLADYIDTLIDGIQHEMITGERSPIHCAAHTDPYVLEQAYEQDEAGLGEQPIDCTGDPLDMEDQMDDNTWQPTHRVIFADGHEVMVMLTDEDVAYTRNEWYSDSLADIEVVDGGWLFQGQPFPGTINPLNDEPTAAGDVTGYDNGPTFH
jgi:hypothetical protein